MQRLSSFILASIFAFGAFGTDSKPVTDVTASKSEKRTKKTAICPACGRPENKCECDERDEKRDKHELKGAHEAKAK